MKKVIKYYDTITKLHKYEEIEVIDGKANGTCIRYYFDGSTKQVSHYKDDKLHGILTDYKHNQQTNTLEKTHSFKFDMGKEIERTDYKEGSIVRKSSIKNGKKHGWSRYYENDIEVSQQYFCEGVRVPLVEELAKVIYSSECYSTQNSMLLQILKEKS